MKGGGERNIAQVSTVPDYWFPAKYCLHGSWKNRLLIAQQPGEVGAA